MSKELLFERNDRSGYSIHPNSSSGTLPAENSIDQVTVYQQQQFRMYRRAINNIMMRFFKLSFKILKKLFPLQLRLIMKKSLPVFIIREIWKKPDIEIWPIPANLSKEGLEKYEYSLFSQNGEDGILRHIFSEIGYKNRYFVEIGFEVTECNSLRLMLKDKLSGVVIDGSAVSVNKFNKAAKRMHIENVMAVNKFLDVENLKPVFAQAGVPEEIDLLSIDIDGNDYWFWNAIDFVNPRVVIVEINASLGPDLSLAVPYDPAFMRHQKHKSGFYCSASLTAFTKLAEKKGYSLIGCDSKGVNAFFIRKDCITENIRQQTPKEAFRPHLMRLKRGFSQEMQYDTIKDMPFVSIE